MRLRVASVTWKKTNFVIHDRNDCILFSCGDFNGQICRVAAD